MLIRVSEIEHVQSAATLGETAPNVVWADPLRRVEIGVRLRRRHDNGTKCATAGCAA
ncbi:hypothetical protein IG631_21719 [Alternaria alternata]|nr:hypothetical protein IG631_21719 [Alternaria alternata]